MLYRIKCQNEAFNEPLTFCSLENRKSSKVERTVLSIKKSPIYMNTLDTLFPSNNNIHKSLCGLILWALDPLIDRFYENLLIKWSEA